MDNLKPLVWHKDSKSWTAYGAGISYSITEFDGVATVSWHNMIKSAKDLPFSSDKKTLLSYSEALGFVEKEHYPHFMSEFVKPSLTWIYASDQLPVSDSSCLCAIVDKGFINYRIMMFWTVVDKFAFDHEKVLAWMRLPEPPISKESDCD